MSKYITRLLLLQHSQYSDCESPRRNTDKYKPEEVDGGNVGPSGNAAAGTSFRARRLVGRWCGSVRMVNNKHQRAQTIRSYLRQSQLARRVSVSESVPEKEMYLLLQPIMICESDGQQQLVSGLAGIFFEDMGLFVM